MPSIRILAMLAAAGAVTMMTGCSSGPPIGPYGPPPIAAGPIVPAYVTGDIIGDRSARVRKARAAGLRVLSDAEVMDYLGRQENELRRQTAGTGVDVIRAGNLLLLRLPASTTFNVGSAEISPQASSTLREIALTLKSFNRSLVDVLGHTDSTGTQAANQALSERRAQAVAARLRAGGVSSVRIATRGYAAAYPIADNGTEQGRALNRRVEIRLIPLR